MAGAGTVPRLMCNYQEAMVGLSEGAQDCVEGYGHEQIVLTHTLDLSNQSRASFGGEKIRSRLPIMFWVNVHC